MVSEGLGVEVLVEEVQVDLGKRKAAIFCKIAAVKWLQVIDLLLRSRNTL